MRVPRGCRTPRQWFRNGQGGPLLRATEEILECIAAQVRLEGTRVVSARNREADGLELLDWVRAQAGRACLAIDM